MATHLLNERALVAAAQHGNHEAFAALVKQYQHNIYHLALRITGNREDAEDALQEALLKAYCNLARFHGKSLFYTWLVRITMNEALMKLRRSKRQGLKELAFEEIWPSISATFTGGRLSDPETCYAQVELHQALSQALSGISARLSDAFILRDVAELSVRETAAMLGLSVAGVKSRVLRARNRLRQRLGEKKPSGRNPSLLVSHPLSRLQKDSSKPRHSEPVRCSGSFAWLRTGSERSEGAQGKVRGESRPEK